MNGSVETKGISPRAEAYRLVGDALLDAAGVAREDADRRLVRDAMDALAEGEEAGGICAPVPESWSGALPAIAARSGDGALPADPRPLIVDSAGRLYFERNFGAELRLAGELRRYAAMPRGAVTPRQEAFLARLEDADYELFGKGDARDVFREKRRLQDEAVRKAVSGRFSVICGGPGTGKTTTVARVLECLLLEEPALRIALAAPTGKAAARIGQSLQGAAERRELFARLFEARNSGQLEEKTLHKWLWEKQGDGCAPSREHPFERDVLVVDESSMVDFDLASRLFAALDPARTRLVLLGDREQLDAVGPGSVFADICRAGGALAQCVTELTESHRFTAESAVGCAARAILSGDEQRTLEALEPKGGIAEEVASGNAASLRVVRQRQGAALPAPVREWLDLSLEGFIAELLALLERGTPAGAVPEVPAALWKAANAFRALASLREGPMSVAEVNAYASERVREALRSRGRGKEAEGDFFIGRIVIVRSNSPALGVYNGDVGVVVPSGDATLPPVVFFGDSQRQFLSCALLPSHDTAFAITVHQSQGSEYDHVAVLLPPAADSGLTARELLYTGVTRAKKTVQVFGGKDVLARAVAFRSERAGGLRERLEAE